MDDLNRSIKDYINSDQYYKDARTWYANKYIFIACIRTYIIFIMLFFITSLTILAFYYNITDPAPPKIEYKIDSDDIARYYSVIFSAGNSSESPQIQVTKYLLSNYVKKREAYNYRNIDNQINFVKNSSSTSEYLKFKWLTSIDNPISPQITYVEDYRKEIAIQETKIISLSYSESEAIVYYKEELRHIASNKLETKNMLAKIKFKIDNIENLVGTNAKKMTFLVTNYNIMEKK